MLWRMAERTVTRVWTPLERIDRDLVVSVIARRTTVSVVAGVG